MFKVGGAASLQHAGDLDHLERVAYGAAQRPVHIGDERADAPSGSPAYGDHGLGELDGLRHGLHKGAGSHLDVE